MKKMLLLFVISATLAFADQASARAAMNRGELVNAEQILNADVEAAQNSPKLTALDPPLDLLAQVYRMEKKFPEAVAAQQRRLDLWTGLFGENAVIVGRILGQMASIEHQAGSLADAESHSRRALAILTAAYPDQPAAAQAATDLADILVAQGRQSEAEQMLAVAQKMYEASVGLQSKLTVMVATRRAALLHQPPPSVSASGVYNVGKNVSAPNILHKVEPEYSEQARQNKLQGSISLSMVIDANGKPHPNRRVAAARHGSGRKSSGSGVAMDVQTGNEGWNARPGVRSD